MPADPQDLNPFESPAAWNVVELGGVESPGIVTLQGFEREFGWDVKKGKGTKGATLTLNTFPPVEGSFTFQLWLKAHFAAWRRFVSIFKYDPPKTKAQAVDVYHPALADIDITSVVCKGISPLTPMGHGLYQVVMKVIEYLPPPPTPKIVTPTGSTNAAGGAKNALGKLDDPISIAKEQTIADLRAKINKKPPGKPVRGYGP